jgi:3-phenylpropionate/cinnamic acid dioxygenase small subunit
MAKSVKKSAAKPGKKSARRATAQSRAKDAAPGKAKPAARRARRSKDTRGGEPLGLAACEAFLLNEARLLDEARFDDWLALFQPDAWYWVPSEPDQADPFETVSLIYDDRRLLETRVRRLASPRMYSQEPRSRTSRIVANPSIEEANGAACTVRSKFMMVEFRRDSPRLFAGTTRHRLVATPGGIKIAWKRVDLVNCDAPMDGITIPF